MAAGVANASQRGSVHTPAVTPGSPNLAVELGARAAVVCCGSGGVGKTTVSAALAMGIVAEYDKRVMVLTIDPARRLAAALGLHAVGPDPISVPAARLRRAGLRPRGELVAAMLDQKSTWDRMVERHAPTRQAAERILANRFYQGISTAFNGSQEYAAMEALYELHSGGEYDCVVVDTPPSRSALDFLEAPDRVNDFVGGRLLSWLAGPSRLGWRAVNLAATPFLRMADRLLGADVLRELGEFVRDLQGLYDGVQQRSRRVKSLLRSADTAFAVVTTLEPLPFAEAEFFCQRLREEAMPLGAVVVNRLLPGDLLDGRAADAAGFLVEHPRAGAAWLSEAAGERVTADTSRRLGAAFLTLHQLAVRDDRQVARLTHFGSLPLARLPLADREVVDIEGLATLTAVLRGNSA